jgi:hypothetical protein
VPRLWSEEVKGGGVKDEAAKPTRYRAAVELSWRDEAGKRVVLPADKASDCIPPESVPWLLASGLIEEVPA